jgi:hypothetical protein
MLHLFNKIYVSPDYLVNNSKKRIIISKNPNIVQKSTLNPIKHQATAYADLVGANGAYKDWHSLLLSLEYEAKLNFYVDMDAFNIIFVNWIKTIFPNMDSNLAFCCYNATVQRSKLHFPAIVLNSSFMDFNKTGILDIVFLNKIQFIELFDNLTPWNDNALRQQWVKQHIEGFSIEWHLANFFNDENHIEVFKDKYIYVLSKALAMEVSEWYFYVIKYFMQDNVKKAFDLNVSWDDDCWREKLKAHPKLYWMFDNELKFITRDSAYFLAHIDEILELGKFLQEFWFKDIQIDDKIRLLDEDYFESNHAHFVFDTLKSLIQNRDNMTSEQINSILKKDFEKDNVSIVFDILTHVQKWNNYILQLVYELKNNNDPRLKQMVFA